MKAKDSILFKAAMLFIAAAFIMLPGARADVPESDPAKDISITYIAKDTSVEDFDLLMDSATEAFRMRLSHLGYSEATVTRMGNDRIRIGIPNTSDPEEVIELFSRPAHLELREPDGSVIVTEEDLRDVYVAMDFDTQLFEVRILLTEEGAVKLAKATSRLIGSTIGMYLDGEIFTEPTITAAILNGETSITLNSSSEWESYQGAYDLYSLILSCKLPLEMEVDEISTAE